MPPEHEIRADFDGKTIVVYQAFPRAIAEPALKGKRFVEPFSFNRMTWIKPSFLWLMHRTNWGQKSGQECILAVRISRNGWEEALSCAVLTSFEPAVHATKDHWVDTFATANVHVQWDPERSLRGAALQHRSIQVGIGRRIIREYTDQWIADIQDLTPLAAKLRTLLRSGNAAAATRHLPPERPYPLNPDIGRKLLIS